VKLAQTVQICENRAGRLFLHFDQISIKI